jgi:hypothetical protein
MGKEKRNKFLKALQGGPLVGLFEMKKRIFLILPCVYMAEMRYIYTYL